MDFRVLHNPVFSIVEFQLDEQEVVVAQPNSMLSMTSGIQIAAAVGRRQHTAAGPMATVGDKTQIHHAASRRGGGVLSGMKSMLGGENFFTAEYRAKRDGQQLTLAPDAYGDILIISLAQAGNYYLTRGSYLANTGACELGIKYSGLKGVMSRKGLFVLHAAGSGTVFCQTYGAIVRRDLAEGERFFVDNRFVVAFSDTIDYQLVKATESVKDSIFSGEGLVNRYTGPGTIYYQTRAKQSEGWLTRLLQATF
jgi:uncharacterized protein (TIGR00266 family)